MTGADYWTSRSGAPALEIPPVPEGVPIGRPDLDRFPRLGCSVANIFLANHYDFRKYAQQLEDNGMEMAGVNLLSAQWPDMAGPKGTWPHVQLSDGRWDLHTFNGAYLDKLYTVINTFHHHGIHVMLCLLELYSWSNRKKSGSPDGNLDRWRANPQGVKWGGKYNGDRQEDDQTLLDCPDEALCRLIDWLAPVWKIHGGITVKIGNEYPEKDLHYRVRDEIRRHNPQARFAVNRNEDTPGQYQNMKIGQEFDLLDHHGWEDLGFLDNDFPEEPDDRPRTFRQFFDKVTSGGDPLNVDHARVIANSDGARANDNPIDTYNWDELFKVHEYCWQHGCSIDHQSQVKMSFNLDNLETAYLARLAALKG
jgi:hypothetical protein